MLKAATYTIAAVLTANTAQALRYDPATSSGKRPVETPKDYTNVVQECFKWKDSGFGYLWRKPCGFESKDPRSWAYACNAPDCMLHDGFFIWG